MRLAILGTLFWATVLMTACSDRSHHDIESRGYNGQGQDTSVSDTIGAVIDVSGSNVRRRKDLEVVCKVWGFLKYYHPNINNVVSAWDSYLIKLLRESATWQHTDQRDAALLSLVNSLGEIDNGSKNSSQSDFLQPDLRWIDTSGLNPQLISVLRRVQYAERSECSRFVKRDNFTSAILFTNEMNYPNEVLSDAGYRLLTLFRLWNAVHYFFPYRTLTTIHWDSSLTTFIPRLAEDDNIRNFELSIYECIARLDDSHAGVSGYSSLPHIMGARRLAIDVEFFDTTAIVTNVYRSPDLENEAHVGDEIVSIHSEPVSRLVRHLRRFVPASHDGCLYRDIPTLMLRTDSAVGVVTVRRNGRLHSVRIPTSQHDVLGTAHGEYRRFVSAANQQNIGIINMEHFHTDSLRMYAQRLRSFSALVVDVRRTAGNHGLVELGEFFLPWPTKVALFSTPDCTTPGRFVNEREHSFGSRSGDHYRGKVIVIVGPKTQSHYEYKAMIIASSPTAILVGSQTAGTNGNITKLDLPGKATLTFTSLGVYYPDRGQTQRRGLRIDHIIERDRATLLTGYDDVLDSAIKLAAIR
ncbi:MAG TPA: S41 family peptidase [Chlorobiota bacterium]|nr:S41 family peptidase [Chlorobiota bacterium]